MNVSFDTDFLFCYPLVSENAYNANIILLYEMVVLIYSKVVLFHSL